MATENMDYSDLAAKSGASQTPQAVNYDHDYSDLASSSEESPKPLEPKSWRQVASDIGLQFPNTPNERQEYKQKMNERLKGAAQELANYPIKVINLVKKNPVSEFNFAPKTEEAKKGELIGDIGSFFIPGMAATNTLKALSYIPKAQEALNALTKAKESSKVLNSLLKIGQTGAETGLYNAVQHPEDAKNAALQGAGIGGGTQAAINLLMTQNPLLRTLGRVGVGAGVGYGLGHPVYGAMAASALPEVGKLLGISGQNALSQHMLEGLNYKDIAKAKNAATQLGTTLTPAQASGNYVTSGIEGGLKRSPQGAQQAYRFEQMQNREQSNAINNMLDSIYKPTKKNEEEITSLYKKANQMNINPSVVDKMKTNPIMLNAFRQVKKDPAFSDLPEHNYEFLSEVDRQLRRDYENALLNKPNTAYAINNTKSLYNQFLKDANPDYLAATKAAQPKIVRRNIEEKFNKNEEDYTGKNFYSKFLNAKKPYKELLTNLKNFPEAEHSVKNMRQAWKHLSNIKSVSQGEAQAKTGLADARDQLKVFVNAVKKYAGAQGDIKGLKYIYSKDWDKSFDKIMQIKEKNTRNKELASLFGKIGSAYGLNRLSQGSDNNGNNI